MKTTIELPQDLFQAAKLTAAQRRITLKTLFTQALRKEIAPPARTSSGLIRVDEDGLPYLAKRGKTVTSSEVDRLDEETGAVSHGGRLATLDKRIDPALVSGGRKALVRVG
jgi:hypothetical protein